MHENDHEELKHSSIYETGSSAAPVQPVAPMEITTPPSKSYLPRPDILINPITDENIVQPPAALPKAQTVAEESTDEAIPENAEPDETEITSPAENKQKKFMHKNGKFNWLAFSILLVAFVAVYFIVLEFIYGELGQNFSWQSVVRICVFLILISISILCFLLSKRRRTREGCAPSAAIFLILGIFTGLMWLDKSDSIVLFVIAACVQAICAFVSFYIINTISYIRKRKEHKVFERRRNPLNPPSPPKEKKP